MSNWLERAILKRLAAGKPDRYGWLYAATTASPGLFLKLCAFSPLATHAKRADRILVHLARIGAMQVYDCGSCLQLAIDFAIKDGVPAELLRRALLRTDGEADDERLAFSFGRATAAAAECLPALAEDVRRRFGDGTLVELSLAAATAAVFPTTKRGLGLASACDIGRLSFDG